MTVVTIKTALYLVISTQKTLYIRSGQGYLTMPRGEYDGQAVAGTVFLPS